MACTSFALDAFIGVLPLKEGVLLYMVRVDPVLAFRCEVVLDGTHSMLAMLFTETGILPLIFCYVKLAIGYLIYLLQLPHSHYAYAALKESIHLLLAGCPS